MSGKVMVTAIVEADGTTPAVLLTTQNGVATTDPRLSDARTPTAHAHAPSEITGTAVVTNDPRLSDTRQPAAHTHLLGTAATSATTGTMTVNMAASDVVTITPTGACTFNATGGTAGRYVTFAITTAGASSFVLTFGTNFRKTGTLATGTSAARFFSVTFMCVNGTIWQEISRTAVQT